MMAPGLRIARYFSLAAVLTACGGGAGMNDAGISGGGATTDAGSLVCPPGGFAGGLTLPAGQNLVLTTACDVNGNLVIGAAGENASLLTVQGAVLTVHGDILLAGAGNLTIRGVGSSLRLDNQHDFQRHIETRGTSSLHLDGCSVVTNIAGASVGKLTSTYGAYDSSTFTATNVTLDTLTNWLLGDFRDSSTALFTNSTQVPTEVYAHDGSTITSTGPSDQHGLWMILASGTSGSLTLPNPTPPVTWSAGRNSGLNVGWQIDLVGSKTSLAIESHAGSSWDIHSSGSSQKETTIAVFVDPASAPAQPMTFANLPLNTVGTSSTPYSITPPGAPAQLSLYGVNLGPIAWQIYAGGGGAASVSVTITNSPINEVVAFAGGHVKFSNSVAQWSVVGAVGANASMHVTGSNLWDARTFASGGGTIRIDTSTLHGSILEADLGSGLEISDTLTQLYANGNSTSKCDIVASAAYMATHNGVPLCNPYSPAGQLPARLGAGGTIAISGGHPACFAAGGSYAPGFVFDPGVHTANPAGGSVQCSGGPQPLSAAFAAYPVNLQGASAGKAYTCVVTTSGGTDTYSVTAPTCQ